MLNKTNIEKFKASLRGELIQRSERRYEEACKLYNGMINKRQPLVARCADVDLFWAVREGGGNFGVVTSSVYKAHPPLRSRFRHCFCPVRIDSGNTVSVGPIGSVTPCGVNGKIVGSLY